MNHSRTNHKRHLPIDNGFAQTPSTDHLHGASIIDETGAEKPITEEMIQQACDELIQAWETTITSQH